MKATAALALVAGFLAGCAGIGPEPSVTTTTAMPAGQHWFRVSWTAEPPRDGARRLTGYLSNEYGSPMGRIQLLAQALDAENAVIAQKIVWFPRELGPFSGSYFEIDGLPAAETYKVTVWSFEVMETDRRRRW